MHEGISDKPGLPEIDKQTALQLLIALAGLRGLEQVVREEVEKLPGGIEIMRKMVIEPAIQHGREMALRERLDKSRQEEYEIGFQEGRFRGALRSVKILIKRRFGGVPDWADNILANLSIEELESVSLRISDVASITELLS